MARMRKRNPLVVGLDVGTYKIGVIVAELAEGGVEITGIGTAVSRGLKKGVVVNIEATIESIRRAVDEAELMAGCEIRSVIAGAAGSHLKGFNSHGVVAGKNLVKCCNRAGLHVRDVLGGPLAAGEAVLTPEERELGVALVDLGAGTTSVSVVHAGAIRHTAVLPVGGGHVTNDLAAALRTPFGEAERLKQRHGSALVQTASVEQTIEVAGVG